MHTIEGESFQPGLELKKPNPLSFKQLGRVLDLKDLEAEFRIMFAALGKRLTPEVASRICKKSGTHLIKLVSPRVDGNHAVLRITGTTGNRSPLLPSVNAADIPFAKTIFRPLEISGQPPKSIVDHLIYPDAVSDEVLRGFASVFGKAVLDEIAAILLGPAPKSLSLAAGEFPVIFIRSPSGGDLQITPVSPAASFMSLKEVITQYFQRQEKDAPAALRGRWHRQAISSKPQNISGAIGGARVRFLAEMPRVLTTFQAELYRYVRGGRFPRWLEPEVEALVMRYADLLDGDREFNNRATRKGLDGLADRLLEDARSHIHDTREDADAMAEMYGISVTSLAPPPSPTEVLLRRPWPENGFDRARRVLSSAHFDYREKRSRKAG